jgi:transposase-like protein
MEGSMGMSSLSKSSATICAEYCRSGLTQKAFCESQGVAKSTLGYWLRRERKQDSEKLPLVRVAAAVRSEESRKMLIRIDDRLSIEIERPVDIEELRLILEAVGSR